MAERWELLSALFYKPRRVDGARLSKWRRCGRIFQPTVTSLPETRCLIKTFSLFGQPGNFSSPAGFHERGRNAAYIGEKRSGRREVAADHGKLGVATELQDKPRIHGFCGQPSLARSSQQSLQIAGKFQAQILQAVAALMKKALECKFDGLPEQQKLAWGRALAERDGVAQEQACVAVQFH